jgi:hypothetical protein
MLALGEVEAATCEGCGGDMNETFATDAQDSYDVEPPYRCHRCTAIHQAAAHHAEHGQGPAHALRFVATRRR